ncbi:MAG: hypothetical protein DCF22_01375 [Leptolyngbya sp.]|nr:MAG: hypothetical protein DCF22_01375 [Leptolyngbya sp.]
MLRRFLVYAIVLSLAVTTVSCGGNPTQGGSSSNPTAQTASAVKNRLGNGQYPVQQATYNDADGEYTVMLLNTKPGDSSAYRTTNLQMAQLTDEEISKGQKSYLKLENNQASMHIEKDFKIDYVHNVTEEQANPQTGQTERVVVRQESSFWSPFAGALAGQAIGSMLFRPQYYVPPVYQSGGIFGHGGYGSNYNQAVSSYQQRYNAPPAAVRNRQTVRSTGNLRTPTASQRRTTGFGSSDRSTGAGFGTNTLRRSNSPSYRQPSRTGFGSGSRSRSFGRRR